MQTTEIHCECGDALGEACAWAGPRSETVVVEWMPHHLRYFHEAAGNAGTWPSNGALRLRVHVDCARILAEDGGEVVQ